MSVNVREIPLDNVKEKRRSCSGLVAGKTMMDEWMLVGRDVEWQ